MKQRRCLKGILKDGWVIVPRWMGDISGDENELKSSLFSSN